MIKNKNDGKFRTLSILICSLQNRSETFNELMDMLNTQLHSRILTDGGWDNWQYQHYVEVIYDIDNGEKTVGEKRIAHRYTINEVSDFITASTTNVQLSPGTNIHSRLGR